MIHLNSDRPITTTEFIVRSLSQDILNGNIKSGSKLKQNEISKRFNVSATPVREALKILTTKGLISFDPFKGAIVKGLCYKEAKEIYELRILLESKLITDAFEKYSTEYLQKAINIQEQIETCTDLNEWALLNANFHRCFWHSESGSRTFNIVETLIMAAIPYVSLSLFYKKTHIKSSNEEHRAILEAYQKKDLKKLIHLNTVHTNKTKNILEDAIKNSL
ncbi:MAG: GntR family transcriptional regulator [Campylobacter gracilis]|uniref:GntR family transcriptional regulator n=1 Tax=Campylobacter gracilis TaxID=824 RepID=UPI0026F13752|nr:GntR family transcriptional regulator [Campylobacter gracilis]MBS6152690.1 GntR family transcriptional regulator [Campylobacter gracilis]